MAAFDRKLTGFDPAGAGRNGSRDLCGMPAPLQAAKPGPVC